jgi:hypothetical protein
MLAIALGKLIDLHIGTLVSSIVGHFSFKCLAMQCIMSNNDALNLLHFHPPPQIFRKQVILH